MEEVAGNSSRRSDATASDLCVVAALERMLRGDCASAPSASVGRGGEPWQWASWLIFVGLFLVPSEDASAEVCQGPTATAISKVGGVVATGVFGSPALLAPDRRLSVFGGAAVNAPSGRARPFAFSMGTSVLGLWNRLGYRFDWSSLQTGVRCPPTEWLSDHVGLAFVYEVTDANSSTDVRISVGPAIGLWNDTAFLEPGLDVGVSVEGQLSSNWRTGGRVRYVPLVDGRTSQGEGWVHAADARIRAVSLAPNWFHPFFGVGTGFTGGRVGHSPPPAFHASLVVGSIFFTDADRETRAEEFD